MSTILKRKDREMKRSAAKPAKKKPVRKKSATKKRARVLWTIGYEGRSLESFVSTLLKNRVEILVDVREQARSRKKGFAKSALSSALEAAGIQYVHFPQLGTSSAHRECYRSGEFDLEQYLGIYTLCVGEQQEALDELDALIKEKRCCLLCVEADHKQCHRSVLAKIVHERSGGSTSITHL
jgi:uncharacterized protein (DUF488 family)